MYEYRSKAFALFVRQLKKSPVRLRLRQLAGIEFLATVIESGRSYPLDFVVHALTGYRSHGAGQSGADAVLVDAETLRQDLVVLAEELSESADIAVEYWPGTVASVAELAERFDVSTKTIFRWHNRGLIGWRFRFGDGRVRLAFPERCVRRFVAENAALVRRGSSFSQLSDAERDGITTRAAELVAAGEKTINAVAKQVASEMGRAVETIRLILKSYDEARPGQGLFNRSPAYQVAGDERLLALWEGYLEGQNVESLAKRFERPIPWVYAQLTELRARDRKSKAVDFIDSEEFALPDARQVALGDPALRHPHDEANPPKRVPRDLPPYLQQLFRLPLLTPAGERALFRKMNYLKAQAAARVEALEPETATAAELDEIEALLASAEEVKKQIVQANLRLVVSIAKRHANPQQDFFEIVSDGNVSLMRAVDKFDYSRGFKFSTYASWAIMKNYARSMPEQRHHYDRYQTGRDEYLETVAGPAWDELDDNSLGLVRQALERMLATLDERERQILQQRYGLDRRGEPETLEQIGKRFGVSKERVRQLEARAMEKLRSDFADELGTLLNG